MISRNLVQARRMVGVRSFSSNQKIDFGFKNVEYEHKQKLVGGVFSSVAEQYDVMNDAMSLGVHRVWKNYFIQQIGPIKKRRVLNDKNQFTDEMLPLRVLDVAGGTGDISFKIL